MRIDSHQHFWRYNQEDFSWVTDDMAILRRDFLPADLLPELSGNGMDGSVLVQASQSDEETQSLLCWANEHEQIKGVVGWVDLSTAGVEKQLQRLSTSAKLCGFRHIVQAEPDDRFMLRPDFCRGIGQLKQFRFTYDILIYPSQLPAAVELVGRFPEQPFVIDHLAKPEIRSKSLDGWAKHMRLLGQAPNVHCKLSGMVTEADWRTWRPDDFVPYLDVVFEAFGPDRLMFGSDWPVCLVAASYRQVKSLVEDYIGRVAPQRMESIFGHNAMCFYGLKGA
jgi:L-fuconolactonase